MSATQELTKATPEQIQSVCDQIVRWFHPERIILFGSYAYGDPSPDSDVDLLVVMRFEGSSREQAARIRSRIDTPVALDLIVRTRNRFRSAWRWATSLWRKSLSRARCFMKPITLEWIDKVPGKTD